MKVKLSYVIPRICSGGYSESELALFIELAQKISLNYLKYQEVIGKAIRWEKADNRSVELNDIAIDCIAGLFMMNEDNEFVQLVRYFGPHLNGAVPSEAELLILLRRLVIKKTKQELARIFKERDPEGAKIIRNIRVAVKNSSDLVLFREAGREYVSFCQNGTAGKTDSDFLRSHLPQIPEKTLREMYLDDFNPKDHTGTRVRKMLWVLVDDEQFQNYIPVDVIVRLIRLTTEEVFRDGLRSRATVDSPLDYIQLKEIEKAKEKALRKLSKKSVNSTYARKKFCRNLELYIFRFLRTC